MRITFRRGLVLLVALTAVVGAAIVIFGSLGGEEDGASLPERIEELVGALAALSG